MITTEVRPAKNSPDDIIMWADGTWCVRYELGGMSHMSDDYEVIRVGEQRWHEIRELPVVA